MTRWGRWLDVLKPHRVSGLWVLVGLAILFSALEPDTFPTLYTVRTVGEEEAVTAIVALALTVPLAAAAFDLSIGGTLGVSSIVCAYMLAHQYPAPIACAAAL